MKNTRLLRWGAGAAIALVLLYVLTTLSDESRGFQPVETSVALQQLADGNVAQARIDDREQTLRLQLKAPITVQEREGVDKLTAQYPARASQDIFNRVAQSPIEKFDTRVTRDSLLMSTLSFLLPMVILFGLLSFFLMRMQNGGMFGFGQSKAKELTKDMPETTFDDVAGADDAVEELQEIKDFLQDPEIYEKLGAKIPRGVLLYGPPGTGKTLLARAVAGEAGVPFFTISGSDFVEMFVGVGASRVRDLFKQARASSPCIIFIDEIDAVGRHRGSGMGGGHDEREQTLNQLLVEMDGFGDREGVILMAATNRPDILDPALLRPGRFDRQIPVDNPDLAGREKILQVHAKGKPLAPDANLESLAKRTAGMSGADLANVLNEAALLTARIGGNVITADALEEATDRVIGGPRRSSKVISQQELKITAYHEGGHTLSAWALKNIERVYKVTILARGRTGGHAMTAQEDDKGMYTRDELFARLVFAMGGRTAEELVFGTPTTGASADIQQATKIARAMVTEYGMAPELGTVKYGTEDADPFSGVGGGDKLSYSDETAAKIDAQVRYLLDRAHRTSYDLLRRYRTELDQLAAKLLEKETLRRPDLEALFEHIEPAELADVFPGEDSHFPQQTDREPVKTPTELALERGEEPPRRFSLVEASRKARAERRRLRGDDEKDGAAGKDGAGKDGAGNDGAGKAGGPAGEVGAGKAGGPAGEVGAEGGSGNKEGSGKKGGFGTKDGSAGRGGAGFGSRGRWNTREGKAIGSGSRGRRSVDNGTLGQQPTARGPQQSTEGGPQQSTARGPLEPVRRWLGLSDEGNSAVQDPASTVPEPPATGRHARREDDGQGGVGKQDGSGTPPEVSGPYGDHSDNPTQVLPRRNDSHPGADAYSDGNVTEWQAAQPGGEPLRGFRLPEHERPDHAPRAATPEVRPYSDPTKALEREEAPAPAPRPDHREEEK